MTTTSRKPARLIVAGTCMFIAASLGPGGLPAAAAPTDIGSTCVASFFPPDVSVVMTAASGDNPLPITPVASGIITRAIFNVPPLAGSTYPTALMTVHATGVANEYTVVAQSPPLPISDGATSFDVRVPIAAGDLLGISSPAQTVACATGNPSDAVAVVAGDRLPGQTATFAAVRGYGIPVVATVEPDIDGDGYGDDTQDECDRSAALQTACPVITLSYTASAKRRSIMVRVSANHTAQVTVTGTAKVDGKSVRLAGGTRTVQPGTRARFSVRYSRALKAALAALPTGRSIRVKLTATTTDVLGQVTTDTSSVRVHGSDRDDRDSRP